MGRVIDLEDVYVFMGGFVSYVDGWWWMVLVVNKDIYLGVVS